SRCMAHSRIRAFGRFCRNAARRGGLMLERSSLLAGGEGLAPQEITGSIAATFAEGCPGRRAAEEEVIEEVDRVGEVELAAVVGIGAVQAGEGLPAQEQIAQE